MDGHVIAFTRRRLEDSSASGGNFVAHLLVGSDDALRTSEVTARFESDFWWPGFAASGANDFQRLQAANWLLPRVRVDEIAPPAPTPVLALNGSLLTALAERPTAMPVGLLGHPREVGRQMRAVAALAPGLLDALSFSTFEGAVTLPFDVIGLSDGSRGMTVDPKNCVSVENNHVASDEERCAQAALADDGAVGVCARAALGDVLQAHVRGSRLAGIAAFGRVVFEGDRTTQCVGAMTDSIWLLAGCMQHPPTLSWLMTSESEPALELRRAISDAKSVLPIDAQRAILRTVGDRLGDLRAHEVPLVLAALRGVPHEEQAAGVKALVAGLQTDACVPEDLLDILPAVVQVSIQAGLEASECSAILRACAMRHRRAILMPTVPLEYRVVALGELLEHDQLSARELGAILLRDQDLRRALRLRADQGTRLVESFRDLALAEIVELAPVLLPFLAMPECHTTVIAMFRELDPAIAGELIADAIESGSLGTGALDEVAYECAVTLVRGLDSLVSADHCRRARLAARLFGASPTEDARAASAALSDVVAIANRRLSRVLRPLREAQLIGDVALRGDIDALLVKVIAPAVSDASTFERLLLVGASTQDTVDSHQRLDRLVREAVRVGDARCHKALVNWLLGGAPWMGASMRMYELSPRLEATVVDIVRRMERRDVQDLDWWSRDWSDDAYAWWAAARPRRRGLRRPR